MSPLQLARPRPRHRRHRALDLELPVLAAARLLRPRRRAPAAAAHLEPRHRGAVLPPVPARPRRPLALASRPGSRRAAARRAASLALAAWTAGRHPQPAFFLLPFRAWELLVGSLLAVAMAAPRRAGPARPLAGARARRHRRGNGRRAARPAARRPADGARLRRHRPRPPLHRARLRRRTRLLAHPIPVGIGLISYSAYLWHQPILAFARIRFGDALPPGTLLGLGAPRAAARLADLGVRRAPVPPPRRRLSRAPARHRRRHPRRAGRRSALAGLLHRRPRRAQVPRGAGHPRLGHRHQPVARRLQDRPRPRPTRSTRVPAA